MARLPFCLCGIRGGDLTRRIDAIMAARRGSELTRTRRKAVVLAMICVLAAPVVGGALAMWPQAAIRPRFEVVSVKPNVSGQPIVAVGLLPLQSSGRFEAPNVTLKQLVWLAYRSEVTTAHISGGPDWIDKDRFDIEAVAPAGLAPRRSPGARAPVCLKRWCGRCWRTGSCCASDARPAMPTSTPSLWRAVVQS